MKDCAGNLLESGDKVAYTTTAYHDLSVGFVVAFTPKKISISKDKNGEAVDLKFPYQVAKLFNQE